MSVGDQMSLKLSISTSEPTVRENIKHITYVVRHLGPARGGRTEDWSPPDCTVHLRRC